MSRILIVDDKEENVYMLQALLSGNGYEVETARHGAEALTKARVHPPSLIVSDLLMPVMDGYTLLRHWKADARLRHVPFIVYTATYTEPEDERLALNLGADAFILKPCDPLIFLERIHAVFHSPSSPPGTPQIPPPGDEKELLKTYSETLIRKLEEKTLQLEESNRSLELALERLQLAMKASRAGTWDYDLLTGQVDWDNQMLALYGKDAAGLEPGPQRWYHAIHPDDLQRVKSIYESVIHGNQDSFDMEFRIHRGGDGALRIIRAMSVVIHDSSGRPARMIGINSDVTEERRREEKLAQALAHEKELAEKALAGDRAKSEFLAVMSHEIRTPLNGILGFSELLAQTPDLSGECKNYARTIVSSGEALLHILDDVLDFSRIESGRLQFQNEPFSPRTVLESTRVLLAQQASEKNLEILLAVEEGLPDFVAGDVGRVRQILFNIAGNAVKFTDHGRVTLSLRTNKKNGRLEFVVSDTGPGIPADQLERIFLPFTQSDSSQTRRHGGVGLGLSISHRLAELMGGDITVRSELGHGTEFVVSLPLVATSAKPVTSSGELPPPLTREFAHFHPLRVLVVEDDKVNLRLILALIRRLGYEPIAAVNGIEAIQAFENFTPDCVFMDIHMPEMDGIEATRRIRALESSASAPHSTFITALTANIFPADRLRCFDAGMNAYLNKPVKLDSIAMSLLEAEKYAKNGAPAPDAAAK